MSEPPVYIPPEDQEGEQASDVANPQGQPAAYPQGQPAAYPQGQQAAYPQGQPMAYPQGQPGAFPQGQPVGYPQGQPGAYPQVQLVDYAPSQPVVYQQGQRGLYLPDQQVVFTQPGYTNHVYHTGSNQGCCDGTTIAEHYNERAGYRTGVVHLVIAFLSIILGSAAYAFPVLQVGYGIWSAIFFYITTGTLGVASKNKKSRVVVAYMVFAILTTFHAFGLFAYEALIAALNTPCYMQYTGFETNNFCDNYNGALAVHAILALMGLVEFILAIVSAVYCCRGSACCCAPAPTNQGVAATTTMQYGQNQVRPMTVVTNSIR